MSTVYTVRQLSEQIKHHLSGGFPFVWVRGEVTNLSRPTSGHVYFGLKDQDALLNCVWFARAQRPQESFDPLTGEVFEDGPRPSLAKTMSNGDEILCAGQVTLYAPRGQCQLVVELAQTAGQGGLAARFEALRRKLGEMGYFAPERKRSVPRNPVKVALITAPTGAVIRDFCTLAGTRGSGAELRLYPVQVQGVTAAPSICAAFQEANNEGGAEVIVLMRGGGSLEDLWAFNEESVAEAVYRSRIPVLAAIGHEGDVSLADMTADLRASTPSHAVPLLWSDRGELLQGVDSMEQALYHAAQGLVQSRTLLLERHTRALRWLSPAQVVERLWERFGHTRQKLVRLGQTLDAPHGQRLVALQERLQRAVQRRWDKLDGALTALDVRLRAGSPEAPLRRGYALVHSAQGRLVDSAAALRTGDTVRLQLRDGEADAAVTMVRLGEK